MFYYTYRILILATVGIFIGSHAYADGGSRADSHAPIGVMADHMHKKGEWMFSYRFMRMEMEDNRSGTNDISPEEIVTTEPNIFFGAPGQPPTLRIVPTEMTTDMHMFGLMYAPSEKVTLMAMLPYLKKEMSHITFMGGMGITRRGSFTTRTEGVGDLKLSGMIRLHDDARHHVHGNLGLSLPTGSNTETDRILTPMGATPSVRLPYPMQLGSGTYDVLAGITYTGKNDGYSWGAQYAGVFRTGSDEGYTLGDKHNITGWLGKLFTPSVSSSLRINYIDVDNIDGRDSKIAGPVQTADPDRQGKKRWDLSLGLNLLGTEGALKGHRVAFEFAKPIHQDLDGSQLKSDFMVTAGYQIAW